MNRRLKPSSGTDKEIIPVDIGCSFAHVTDYGKIFFLKEIKVSPGQRHWQWVAFDSNTPIDISQLGDRYCTFNNALNRAINDVYCNVYMYETWEEMVYSSHALKYEDNVATVYEARGK